jgi:hypothetical protein
MAELKVFELEVDFDFESNPGGKRIIDVEPSSIITTTKVRQSEPKEWEEGQHLFHSHMWVNGSSLHFIVDSGSQKNMISVKVVKRLDLPTKPHPQPYTIG